MRIDSSVSNAEDVKSMLDGAVPRGRLGSARRRMGRGRLFECGKMITIVGNSPLMQLDSGLVEDLVQTVLDEDGHGFWERPLAAFADARSPLFDELRTVAYKGHRMPDDYLEGARTVVSYFLPFKESLAVKNCFGSTPSETWTEAYNATNAVAVKINEAICGAIRSEGYRCEAPKDAGTIVDGTYSCWSQRHVAYIAGLGTFGMNNMLITDKGSCGRFFSVVTDMPAKYGAPPEHERCLYKIDGSCGLCMNRCVAGALAPGGFDRKACLGVCLGNAAEGRGDVCGKCAVTMPCSHRNPSF